MLWGEGVYVAFRKGIHGMRAVPEEGASNGGKCELLPFLQVNNVVSDKDTGVKLRILLTEQLDDGSWVCGQRANMCCQSRRVIQLSVASWKIKVFIML